MKQIDLQTEWEVIIKKFNSPNFDSYTKEQKERWFNSQLLLITIENSKNIKQKLLLESLYFILKKSIYV